MFYWCFTGGVCCVSVVCLLCVHQQHTLVCLLLCVTVGVTVGVVVCWLYTVVCTLVFVNFWSTCIRYCINIWCGSCCGCHYYYWHHLLPTPPFFPAARSQTSTTTHATLLLSIGAAESSGGRDEVWSGAGFEKPPFCVLVEPDHACGEGHTNTVSAVLRRCVHVLNSV